MKKLVLVFLVAFVLFGTIFKIDETALADDSTIPAVIKGIENIHFLTDEECGKIVGGPMIPPDAQRSIIEINTEELMLPPCVYWLFGKEKKFQADCLKKTTFLSIPPGAYVLYVLPEKSPAVIEVMKRRAMQRP